MSREEMHLVIKNNLKEKTGKDLNAWVAFLKKNGPKEKKEKLAWLKSECNLGHFQAKIIVAEVEK